MHIESLGPGNGIIGEWVSLHDSFRLRGLAGRYYGKAWNDEAMAQQDHAANGFASAYGGLGPVEDIAELTAWAVTGHLFTGPARFFFRGQACAALRGRAGSAIPDELAAVFAKLKALRGMGFIDERSFAKCAGPLEPH